MLLLDQFNFSKLDDILKVISSVLLKLVSSHSTLVLLPKVNRINPYKFWDKVLNWKPCDHVVMAFSIHGWLTQFSYIHKFSCYSNLKNRTICGSEALVYFLSHAILTMITVVATHQICYRNLVNVIHNYKKFTFVCIFHELTVKIYISCRVNF